MKKYLLSLLLVCAGFISFCSAESLVLFASGSVSVQNHSSYSPLYSQFISNGSFVNRTFCLSGYVPSGPSSSDYYKSEFRFGGNDSVNYSLGGNYYSFYLINGRSVFGCVKIGNYSYNPKYLTIQKSSNSSSYAVSLTLDYEIYELLAGGGSSSCDPQYTSEECQSEYNLVPLSNLTSCQGDLTSCQSSLSGSNSSLSSCQSDLSSCQSSLSGSNSSLTSCQSDLSSCSSSLSSCNSNLSGCMTNLDNYSTSLNTCSTNLNVCNTSLSSCMSSNCPSDSGAVSWSSLFVNGIQHLGAPTIRVNIPEEISWDYLSTSEDFVLDVEGYNQDTEYIESVLEVQNYTPTREDFNNTFMLFKSFSGLLVATLFVILVFYLLKKLFK